MAVLDAEPKGGNHADHGGRGVTFRALAPATLARQSHALIHDFFADCYERTGPEAMCHNGAS
ncbi:hypothetical protein BN2476_750099 [Paraburkholderia piptadeniae]|uniref:Uncharacterized protein n=1 Tax=Paraburkholderia piptadeniae TaxID=1701573 RepID=A0A1N7SS20_9BURK|nr:hypothetical protein BN2476_750099 [Paraburkholderia piptadeniae]